MTILFFLRNTRLRLFLPLSSSSENPYRQCAAMISLTFFIGAALGGMRPIVEVMTVNFSLLALDQIVNNAATLRHMGLAPTGAQVASDWVRPGIASYGSAPDFPAHDIDHWDLQPAMTPSEIQPAIFSF